MLRNHMKRVHDKENGTWSHCNICHFIALNENHLKLHKARHHKELACNKCDFKTRTEGLLKDHIKRRHNRNSTQMCRYWIRNACKKLNCQFLYQRVRCKFGNNCRKENCQYEHMQTENPSQTPVWINPAFVENQTSYNQNFPFLGVATLQQQRRRIGN